MLKGLAYGAGGVKLLLLGLSARNIALLQEKKPIDIDLEPFGLGKAHVIIFAGETEAKMTEEIKAGGLTIRRLIEPLPREDQEA